MALAAGDPALAHVDDYGADAILLDSPTPGSGKVFDWSLAEGLPIGRRLILAGGLTPENVADAVAEVQPWGVDASTGVEVSATRCARTRRRCRPSSGPPGPPRPGRTTRTATGRSTGPRPASERTPSARGDRRTGGTLRS